MTKSEGSTLEHVRNARVSVRLVARVLRKPLTQECWQVLIDNDILKKKEKRKEDNKLVGKYYYHFHSTD